MTAIRHCYASAVPCVYSANILILLYKLFRRRPFVGGRRSGETAARRQFLPGRLRPVNHKTANLAASRRENDRCALTDRTAFPRRSLGQRQCTSSTGFALPDDRIGHRGPRRGGAKGSRQYRRAAGDAGHRGGSGRAPPAFGAARQRRARRAGRPQDPPVVRQFRRATVSRLRDAAANLKSASGDPGLDAVLSEIELRVEVELAKAGQFQRGRSLSRLSCPRFRRGNPVLPGFRACGRYCLSQHAAI